MQLAVNKRHKLLHGTEITLARRMKKLRDLVWLCSTVRPLKRLADGEG
jgi:hypothetical protein